MTQKIEDGVDACRSAFERLKTRRSEIPAHNAIAFSKITAGIVSVEAGFDRGYLKKARASHIGLIEEINKFRASMALNLPNARQALKQAQENAQFAESEKLQLQQMIQKVVAQNLQLVERVRQLESQVKEIRTIKSMVRHSSLRE